MEQTPNLSLPFMLGSQAQKHVTHNDALNRLDALVQASVKDYQAATPPPSDPAEGERYIVPSGASGAWSGRDGQVAAFQDGAWVFYAPRPGWSVYAVDAAVTLVWDGSGWRDQLPESVGIFGINATADSTNRLAVKSDAVLLSHDDVTPGSGDIRAVVDKAGPDRTASLLFQSAYSGRAEIGLTGSDGFSLKTSSDGSTFRESLVADDGDGSVRFPQGVSDLGIGSIGGLRLVLNGDGRINQRGFVGGALASGVYVFDRWRAGSGGCSVSNTVRRWTLQGSLGQVIESPGLAGRTVTLSVDTPTGDIAVDVGGESATIAAGTSRRGATLMLPVGATGDIVLTLSAPAGADFADVPTRGGPGGDAARAPAARPGAFSVSAILPGAASERERGLGAGHGADGQQKYVAVLPLAVPLRTSAAVSFSGTIRIYRYDGAYSDATDLAFRTLDGALLRLTVMTETYPGSGIAIFFPFAGSSLSIDAEF